MLQRWSSSTCFVGEDGALPSAVHENPSLYYPEDWAGWSPGLNERAEWAYKFYKFNASTVLQKTPTEFAKYQLGKWIEVCFGDSHWYYVPKSRKPVERLSKKLFETLKQLTREYDRDRNSMKEIRLVWRKS